MRIVLLDGSLTYDGRQLSTAFVDAHAPDERDAAILFFGPADVPPENLVDLEDAEARAFIASPLMAHLVVEHRDLQLAEAVWRQRVLVRLAAEWIAARAGMAVAVRGNDLFVGDGKLSVSVATRSPRGSLIHFAVNVETEGTPVPAAGLRDLRIPTRDFLRSVARLYEEELRSVAHATEKVRPVP